MVPALRKATASVNVGKVEQALLLGSVLNNSFSSHPLTLPLLLTTAPGTQDPENLTFQFFGIYG